jgi:hypothetical protein
MLMHDVYGVADRLVRLDSPQLLIRWKQVFERKCHAVCVSVLHVVIVQRCIILFLWALSLLRFTPPLVPVLESAKSAMLGAESPLFGSGRQLALDEP